MAQQEKSIAKSTIVILAAIFGLIAYFVNVRPILANRTVNLGFAQMQLSNKYVEKYTETGDKQYLEAAKNSLASGIMYFDKALSYGTYQNSEFREGYSEALFSLPLTSLLSETEKKEVLDKTIAELEKNLTANKQDSRMYLEVMSVYNKAAQYDARYYAKAEALSSKILFIDPNHPQTYFELGKSKFAQSQFEESINYFKKAIDLNPNNVTSHWNLTIAYIKMNQKEEAKAEIEIMERLGYSLDTPSEIQKWIGLYEQLGNTDKLVQLYDQIITKHTPTAACYAQAAVANQKAGDKKKAKEYAIKAAEMDTTLKNKVEAFIKELE